MYLHRRSVDGKFLHAVALLSLAPIAQVAGPPPRARAGVRHLAGALREKGAVAGGAWGAQGPTGAPGLGLLLHGWLFLLLGDSRVFPALCVFAALPWCLREVMAGMGHPGGVLGGAASHLTHQPLRWT